MKTRQRDLLSCPGRPRRAVRRALLRGRDDHRSIYCRPICPARTPGQRSLPILPQRRAWRSTRASGPACVAGPSWRRGTRRSMRWDERPGWPRRGSRPGPSMATAAWRRWPASLASARDSSGGRSARSTASRRSSWPRRAACLLAKQAAHRDELAADRGRPRQRLRQRAPVQCAVPLALLDDRRRRCGGPRARAPLARRLDADPWLIARRSPGRPCCGSWRASRDAASKA